MKRCHGETFPAGFVEQFDHRSLGETVPVDTMRSLFFAVPASVDALAFMWRISWMVGTLEHRWELVSLQGRRLQRVFYSCRKIDKLAGVGTEKAYTKKLDKESDEVVGVELVKPRKQNRLTWVSNGDRQIGIPRFVL